MKIMITSAGLIDLQEKLSNLRGKEMKEALIALADAREAGDISENSEYAIAKENINMLSIKIKEAENKLRNCVVVNKNNVGTDSVQLFTNVEVLNTKTNECIVFSIVTDDQIDISNKKISQNSPIAQGLIGKKKGSVVKVNVPVGLMEFKIIDISTDDV